MRSILVLATVSVAALVATTAGLAGQPVTQTLNPPPPPWQTCMAVGDGTICEGTNIESDGPYDTGIVCGSGANTFDIFDTSTDNYSVWKKFDTDGNLVRRVFHDHYTFGQFSNPLNGAVVPYTQTDTRIDVLAVPGDLNSATETTTWGSVFHLPGAGAPVFWNSGRTVQFPIFGATEFSAGRLDLFQLSDGDTSVLGPLCAALGG
ncbi:MAG TPA: hypothetical protein VKD46_03330 [bacterium]|nr:hypothetical protein [bacterium]